MTGDGGYLTDYGISSEMTFADSQGRYWSFS